MVNKKAAPLHENSIGIGLPRLFCKEPDGEHFTKFLGMNRDQRKKTLSRFSQEIESTAVHWGPSLKGQGHLLPGVKDRRRLLILYSNPIVRRACWKQDFKSLESKKTLNRNFLGIEYIVLCNLYSKISCGSPVDSVIQEAFGDWPDLVERVSSDSVPWGRFSAAAWLELIDQLEHVDTLSEEHRDHLGLQVFAIATIVDDVRLLSCAAKQSDWLSGEFAELIKNSEHPNVPEKPETKKPPTLITRWNQYCAALARKASQAEGPSPDLDALTEIKALLAKMEQMEDALRRELEYPSYRDLMDYLESLFCDGKSEACFTWLNATVQQTLTAQWEKAWATLAPDVTSAAFEKLKTDAPENMERVRNTNACLDSANRSLESLGEHPPSDFMERHRWKDKRACVEEAIITCKRDVSTAELETYQSLGPPPIAGNDSDQPKGSSDVKIPPADLKKHAPDMDKKQPGPKNTTPAPKEETVSDSQIIAVESKSNAESTADTDEKSLALDVTKANQDESKASSEVSVSTDNTHNNNTESTSPNQHRESDETDTIQISPTEQIVNALLDTPPRLAYSFQVARLAHQLDALPPELPIAALEASLYSNYLRMPDGKIDSALRKIFESLTPLPDIANDTSRDIAALITLAATLRPSLLAPHSGALGFLSGFQTSNLGAVYTFAKAVTEQAQLLQGIRVDSSVLRGARSEASWSAEYDLLKEDTKTWYEQAPHKNIFYGPATNIWQNWLKQDGLIGRLIFSIISTHKLDASDFQSTVNLITDRRSFEDHVHKTNRNGPQPRRRRDYLHSAALDQLHHHASQAVELAQRSRALEKTRPSESDFLTTTLNNLRMDAEKCAPVALDELGKLVACGPSLLSGAAHVAAHAINRFQILFDPDHKGADREPDTALLLSSGLFNYSAVSISPDGFPVCDRDTALAMLLNHHNRSSHSHETAFSQRLENGDLETAEKMIRWAKIENLDDIDRLETQFEYALSEQMYTLDRLIHDIRQEVESALALGYLTDADRNRHDAIIVGLEKLRSDKKLFRFDHARNKLLAVREQLKESLEDKKKKALRDLKRLQLDSDGRQYNLVFKTIERDDIVTANELIDRILRGEPEIREDAGTDPLFSRFFPKMIRDIDSALEQNGNLNVITAHIRSGDHFAGLHFGKVAEAQRESAERMLNIWHYLKKTGTVKPDTLDKTRELFSELGFLVRGARQYRQDRIYYEMELRTEPLEERMRCPIPAYGSNTAGLYRIVILWGRPTVEDILQFEDDHSIRKATIVLFMGRLGEEKRREVAQLSRERTRNLLVIDENLLIFLCAEKNSRVPTLFACALPFTYVQPYITTAGILPPEMFYGREREIKEVADPDGPCFIYGGRQLGKTALLRAVEQKMHQPKNNQYALWIDLKNEGIGYDRGPSEIWPALWRSLQTIGAIANDLPDPNPNIRGRVDSFVNDLRSGFSKNSGRTLLLLLDEADRFLEVDAREDADSASATGYRESSRLKSLMDGTDHSIKVIFAGLHNVLRTVEYSNHPLAHFGQPIQIGPLLADGAWRSAEALLREPLLASGYTFDPPNLITRVLAQTNYYPSLIQLYGSALIKAMVPRRISGVAPLYSITEEVLDETYQNRNLRDMIRSRFHLTLQLDPRYEVIAYSIAYSCLENDTILEKGIDQREIDDDVRSWWPEGFRDIEAGTDRFRSLLDEMDGLGVLRNIKHRRYTLRNPNLLLLMGNQDEISNNLLRTREPPQEFEPELFRARNPLKTEGHTRSPLTFHQERTLRLEKNSVTVLCGFRASGLDEVLPFLQARSSEAQVIELKELHNRQQFEEALKRLERDRKEGTTIYVVSQTVPWSEHWVAYALKRMSKLHAKGRYAHVLFLSDAEHLWLLQTGLEPLNNAGLKWLSLRPWHKEFLRQWMEDVGYGDHQETRLSIAEKTGLWPELLMQFHALGQKHVDPGTALEKLDETINHCADNSMRANFGLKHPDACRALRPLAILEEAHLGELIDEVSGEGIAPEILRSRLHWAERLHLVRNLGKNRWQFDPVAAKLIA